VPENRHLPSAVHLEGVDLRRGELEVLRQLDWLVQPWERWVLLGPNGSGKTTLAELCCGYLHPSRGRAWILGAELGRVDVRRLRRSIGITSGALGARIPGQASALEVVLSGARGALEPWWDDYSPQEHQSALDLLQQAGVAHLAARRFGVLSAGERQQVLLARALMCQPGLVILDEPAAGLDMAAREQLVSRLAALARRPGSPAVVLVTHHVEEIPEGFTHAMLLCRGRPVAAGPLESTLSSKNLSEAFGVPLRLSRVGDRWFCQGVA
jgi:iron complex transport system ATP-binding protein